MTAPMMTHDRLAHLIRTLLEYNWDDELNDFREHVHDDGGTHIFRCMVELDNYLNGEQRTAESWLED